MKENANLQRKAQMKAIVFSDREMRVQKKCYLAKYGILRFFFKHTANMSMDQIHNLPFIYCFCSEDSPSFDNYFVTYLH